MKSTICLVVVLCASLVCGVAWSQNDPDSFSDDSTFDESSNPEPTPAPQPAAQISTTGLMAGAARSYPSVSLAIKMDLFSLPIAVVDDATVLSMTYPVLFEFAVDIMWRFSVFFAFGTYVGYLTAENDDEEYEFKENTGVFLLQGGARINIFEPRPKHAHIYIPVDFTGAIGIAKLKDSTEDDMNDAEEALQERMDHCIIGTGFGMEYLVVSEFGIGAEFGLRWIINNLKDASDNDPHITGGFFTSLNLRLSYHF
ncbi:MAG: hypothetical protein GY854_11825 [Deltaproteobacteria bacterium]|nr:hypothetical protein [Deltaproteobacteria bacterium]